MATRPEHLFISSDGNLYDTRVPDWYRSAPLRANFKCGHTEIASCADLKATLRYGQYAWPGGYPLYFMASDGGALSFEAVRDNLRQVMNAIQQRDNSGWRVVACDINWEDSSLVCDHTGKPIESAYGEPDKEESIDC